MISDDISEKAENFRKYSDVALTFENLVEQEEENKKYFNNLISKSYLPCIIGQGAKFGVMECGDHYQFSSNKHVIRSVGEEIEKMRKYPPIVYDKNSSQRKLRFASDFDPKKINLGVDKFINGEFNKELAREMCGSMNSSKEKFDSYWSAIKLLIIFIIAMLAGWNTEGVMLAFYESVGKGGEISGFGEHFVVDVVKEQNEGMTVDDKGKTVPKKKTLKKDKMSIKMSELFTFFAIQAQYLVNWWKRENLKARLNNLCQYDIELKEGVINGKIDNAHARKEIKTETYAFYFRFRQRPADFAVGFNLGSEWFKVQNFDLVRVHHCSMVNDSAARSVAINNKFTHMERQLAMVNAKKQFGIDSDEFRGAQLHLMQSIDGFKEAFQYFVDWLKYDLTKIEKSLNNIQIGVNKGIAISSEMNLKIEVIQENQKKMGENQIKIYEKIAETIKVENAKLNKKIERTLMRKRKRENSKEKLNDSNSESLDENSNYEKGQELLEKTVEAKENKKDKNKFLEIIKQFFLYLGLIKNKDEAKKSEMKLDCMSLTCKKIKNFKNKTNELGFNIITTKIGHLPKIIPKLEAPIENWSKEMYLCDECYKYPENKAVRLTEFCVLCQSEAPTEEDLIKKINHTLASTTMKLIDPRTGLNLLCHSCYINNFSTKKLDNDPEVGEMKINTENLNEEEREKLISEAKTKLIKERLSDIIKKILRIKVINVPKKIDESPIVIKYPMYKELDNSRYGQLKLDLTDSPNLFDMSNKENLQILEEIKSELHDIKNNLMCMKVYNPMSYLNSNYESKLNPGDLKKDEIAISTHLMEKLSEVKKDNNYLINNYELLSQSRVSPYSMNHMNIMLFNISDKQFEAYRVTKYNNILKSYTEDFSATNELMMQKSSSSKKSELNTVKNISRQVEILNKDEKEKQREFGIANSNINPEDIEIEDEGKFSDSENTQKKEEKLKTSSVQNMIVDEEDRTELKKNPENEKKDEKEGCNPIEKNFSSEKKKNDSNLNDIEMNEKDSELCSEENEKKLQKQKELELEQQKKEKIERGVEMLAKRLDKEQYAETRADYYNFLKESEINEPELHEEILCHFNIKFKTLIEKFTGGAEI